MASMAGDGGQYLNYLSHGDISGFKNLFALPRHRELSFCRSYYVQLV